MSDAEPIAGAVVTDEDLDPLKGQVEGHASSRRKIANIELWPFDWQSSSG